MAEEKKGKGCLIGLLTIVGIVVVGIVAVIIILSVKGDDIMKAVFEQAKDTMPQLLTENHTQEERAEFTKYFDQFIDDVTKEGLQEGIGQYQDVIKQLQVMIEDRRITRDESERWIELYLKSTDNTK